MILRKTWPLKRDWIEDHKSTSDLYLNRLIGHQTKLQD